MKKTHENILDCEKYFLSPEFSIVGSTVACNVLPYVTERAESLNIVTCFRD
jgi:hypothetical protein